MSEKTNNVYHWSTALDGVYVKKTNRGLELTKEPVVHTTLENETQEDSATNNQPSPSLKDPNSTHQSIRSLINCLA